MLWEVRILSECSTYTDTLSTPLLWPLLGWLEVAAEVGLPSDGSRSTSPFSCNKRPTLVFVSCHNVDGFGRTYSLSWRRDEAQEVSNSECGVVCGVPTLVGVPLGVPPFVRVRSMMASTRRRRACRSSSSFFSRKSVSRRCLSKQTPISTPCAI